MPDPRDMGPTAAAREAAATSNDSDALIVARALAAVHDRQLGLDRSISLRAVIDLINARADETVDDDEYELWFRTVADFLEEVFEEGD